MTQLTDASINGATGAAPNEDRHSFFATCPKGFESLLADELRSLGTPEVRPLRGQVAFGGAIRDAYRVCLWSRLASRVILVLGHVDVHSSDSLYQGLSAIAWEDQLGQGATMAVDAHGTNDALRNTQFTALRTKDAIADRMSAHRGSRPIVDTSRPDVRVVVRISRERATVGIDLTGEPLFHRGYETAHYGRGGHGAFQQSLRADYAAALLAAGGWYKDIRHDDACLVSIYPGSGVILAEAASQALDKAPGLLRPRWGFQGWAGHDVEAWNELLEEAHDRADQAREDLAAGRRKLSLICFDDRRASESEARHMLRGAGMDVMPDYLPITDLQKLKGTEPGMIVCDLSWIASDEISQEAATLSDVASALDSLMQSKQKFRGLATIARSKELDDVVALEPSSQMSIILGRDPAFIKAYELEGTDVQKARKPLPQVQIPSRTGGAPATISVFQEGSDQFAKRLVKVAKARAKWAKREDISCYRVYDSDLPDYAVSIDLFQGSEIMPSRHGSQRWLQIYEYAAPKEIDPALAHRRLLDVLAIAPKVLGVSPKNTFIRVRTKSRGGSQYAAEAVANAGGRDGRPNRRPGGRRPGENSRPSLPPLAHGAHLIDEGGLVFEVNFQTRLDCGIFLDHRETRSMLRELAKKTYGSKRFLNLFAYTGTGTCYAADGGCKHTTTVDMSAPSLAWAKRNMERNGFVGDVHEYVQADVISWVTEQRHTPNRWDLIFCDVPTFSNSKSMRGSWDVQRDHAELLIGISRILTANGMAVFSCNLRNFKPDVEKMAKAGVQIKDITDQTIPEDFSRNKRIHHCYLVRRTPRPESELGDEPRSSSSYRGGGSRTGRGSYQDNRGDSRGYRDSYGRGDRGGYGRPGRGYHNDERDRYDRGSRGGGHYGRRGDDRRDGGYRDEDRFGRQDNGFRGGNRGGGRGYHGNGGRDDRQGGYRGGHGDSAYKRPYQGRPGGYGRSSRSGGFGRSGGYEGSSR